MTVAPFLPFRVAIMMKSSSSASQLAGAVCLNVQGPVTVRVLEPAFSSAGGGHAGNWRGPAGGAGAAGFPGAAGGIDVVVRSAALSVGGRRSSFGAAGR